MGADRILEPPFRKWIAGKRVGLVSNPAGVNSQLEPATAILARAAGTELAALFGPEHGFLGHAAAGRAVAGTTQIHSLFGQTRKPSPRMLAPLDVLVFDLQDMGVRFYTFVSTLFLCMQAAAERGIPLVVLDRPNPIGGTRVEGPLLEPAFRSFVGVFEMPIRYGMTCGELARLFEGESKLGCDLKVVPLRGWNRNWWYDQTGLQWVCPSPDMAGVATATVYPGFCLLEGINISVGRGTVRPFELFGAPWFQSETMALQLNGLRLPGAKFRPQAFTPTAGRYRGKLCRGIQVHVLDRERFKPLSAALHFLRAARQIHPSRLQWRVRHFDRLAGTDRLRRALLRGDSTEAIESGWQSGVDEFRRSREPYLLYP